HARRDLPADAAPDAVRLAGDGDVARALEPEQELPRARVPVPRVAAARGDPLLDHAQVVAAEEVPPVAFAAPDVVRRGLRARDFDQESSSENAEGRALRRGPRDTGVYNPPPGLSV